MQRLSKKFVSKSSDAIANQYAQFPAKREQIEAIKLCKIIWLNQVRPNQKLHANKRVETERNVWEVNVVG